MCGRLDFLGRAHDVAIFGQGIPLDPLRSIEMLNRDGISPSFGAGADPCQSLRTKSMETTDVARVRKHETQ